jgi:hypothetical protein
MSVLDFVVHSFRTLHFTVRSKLQSEFLCFTSCEVQFVFLWRTLQRPLLLKHSVHLVNNCNFIYDTQFNIVTYLLKAEARY